MKKLYLLALTALGSLMTAHAAQDVTLFGQLYNGNGDYGVYSFSSAADNDTRLKVAEVAAEPNCGSVYVAERLYVFTAEGGEYGTEYAAYVYDASDGFKFITRIGSAYSIARPQQVLAAHPRTGKIYSAFQEGGESYLGLLDISGRSMTKIGSALDLFSSYIVAMAFDPEGTLYAIASNSVLYKVDIQTGDLAYVGMTGVWPEYEQSMAFSPDATQIYWAACNDDINALYSVNPVNGRATKIKDFTGNIEYVTLWAGDPDAAPDSPAAPANPTVIPDAGALTGTVAFDVPDKTHAGGKLTDAVLEYEITADGAVAGAGTCVPAARCMASVKVSASGVYTFKIVLKNAAGYGESAETEPAFFGIETPGAVLDARMERGPEADRVTVSWSAPTVGEHGQSLDGYTVKYRVRRMPSFEVVSEDAVSPLTDTYFPALPELLSYEITAYTVADQPQYGIPMTTNTIMTGRPLDVPYVMDFSANDDVLRWTVYDANDDGHSWEWQYDMGYFRIYDNELAKDDWLISPYVAMEAGAEYRIGLDVMSLATEEYEIRIGRGREPADMLTTLKEKESLATDYEWVGRECTFTCPETGNYHIGIHAMTADPTNALALYADNFKVEKTGADSVRDISAESSVTEYYNLQGIRVSAPVPGRVYIVRRGAETFKIKF